MRAGATFRTYLLNRPYGFGRGNSESWAFITAARGDPALPDASAWTELRGYLRSAGYEDHLLAAAKVVWASYKSYRHRLTAGGADDYATLGVTAPPSQRSSSL